MIFYSFICRCRTSISLPVTITLISSFLSFMFFSVSLSFFFFLIDVFLQSAPIIYNANHCLSIMCFSRSSFISFFQSVFDFIFLNLRKSDIEFHKFVDWYVHRFSIFIRIVTLCFEFRKGEHAFWKKKNHRFELIYYYSNWVKKLSKSLNRVEQKHFKIMTISYISGKFYNNERCINQPVILYISLLENEKW